MKEVIEIIVKLSEGNPGAVVALSNLCKTQTGLIALGKLMALDIRGYQIHLGFKDFCKGDIEVFGNKLLSDDCEDMMTYIRNYK